jgi:hypothetical protein
VLACYGKLRLWVKFRKPDAVDVLIVWGVVRGRQRGVCIYVLPFSDSVVRGRQRAVCIYVLPFSDSVVRLVKKSL